MLQCTIAGGRTKGVNKKSFVFVHQHRSYDVTWKPPTTVVCKDFSGGGNTHECTIEWIIAFIFNYKYIQPIVFLSNGYTQEYWIYYVIDRKDFLLFRPFFPRSFCGITYYIPGFCSSPCLLPKLLSSPLSTLNLNWNLLTYESKRKQE